MKLNLLPGAPDGVFRVTNEGHITLDDFTASGRNPLEVVVGPAWASSRVLLDLRQTAFIDSSAIGWLIGCHKEFKRHGGMLVVHSVPPRVEQVLSLLKIDRIVPLASSESAALALMAGAAV